MFENENKCAPQELCDNDLEQVAGGDDERYIDLGDHAPIHWTVTCLNCKHRFAINYNKACPKCGHTEVYLGTLK